MNDKITSNNKGVEKACLETLRALGWTWIYFFNSDNRAHQDVEGWGH
jgi:hypothetical protein